MKSNKIPRLSCHSINLREQEQHRAGSQDGRRALCRLLPQHVGARRCGATKQTDEAPMSARISIPNPLRLQPQSDLQLHIAHLISRFRGRSLEVVWVGRHICYVICKQDMVLCFFFQLAPPKLTFGGVVVRQSSTSQFASISLFHFRIYFLYLLYRFLAQNMIP